MLEHLRKRKDEMTQDSRRGGMSRKFAFGQIEIFLVLRLAGPERLRVPGGHGLEVATPTHGRVLWLTMRLICYCAV